MALTDVSSTCNELYFLKFNIDDLKGPNLPTNGDVLRHYFHRHRSQPNDAPRDIARVVVDKCIKIWSDNGIPTTHDYNGIKYLLNMLKKFNVMRNNYKGINVINRRHIMAIWEQKFELIFSIATKDAVKKCREKSRKMLLAAKEKEREFRKTSNNDKWLVDFEKLVESISKSSKQSKAKDFTVDTKELVGKPKLKQNVSRAGPKSSKKLRFNDASIEELSIASVTSILSNSDTLNNNEATALTKSPEHESYSIQKELDYEKQCMDVVHFNGLHVYPEEDIVAPIVQKIIIKEEVNIDWDQSDNCSTSLLFHDNFSLRDKENHDLFDH